MQGKEKRTRKLNSGTIVEAKWPNEIRSEWGMEIKEFLDFDGKVLESPLVKFRNDTARIVKGKLRIMKTRLFEKRTLANCTSL